MALIAPGSAPAHAAVSCTPQAVYDYTGAAPCLTIPADVTAVTFDAYGAGGGSGTTDGGTGALGAEAKVTMAVTPGQSFLIYVGGAGAEASKASGSGSPSVSGGWNGGGRGGGSNGTVTTSGGGGGGATDIRTAGSLDSRVLVAAGGGGGGGWGGGVGKGGTGGQGGGQGAGEGYGSGPDSGPTSRYLCTSVPGAGGAENAGGGAGRSGDPTATCYRSGGGGLTSGGHYDYAGHDTNWDGTLGQGGQGGCLQFPDCSTNATVTGGGGGGGGGGFYGGAGAEVFDHAFSTDAPGGGGGGSSYGPAGTTFSRGFNPGSGKLFVTFSTTVALSSSINPNVYYNNTTYTARVSPAPPSGVVQFQTDGYDVCIGQPLSNGVAQCTLAPNQHLVVGSHNITARYLGGGGYAAGTASLNQLAVAHTQTDLAATTAGGAAATTVASGQPVTLTATTQAFGAPVQTPRGGVTFLDNGTPLQTVWPNTTANGTQATLVTGLTLGAHTLTASYLGTILTATSTSGPVSVQANGPIPGGTYRLGSALSGKSLEVRGASQANGAAVDQRTYSGASNQQWLLSPQTDGSYIFTARHSGLVLDVVGANIADASDVDQWPSNGGANQRWWIAPDGGGKYHVLSVNSGKALDVKGGSTANGADVIQYTYRGASNQQWRIVATP